MKQCKDIFTGKVEFYRNETINIKKHIHRQFMTLFL